MKEGRNRGFGCSAWLGGWFIALSLLANHINHPLDGEVGRQLLDGCKTEPAPQGEGHVWRDKSAALAHNSDVVHGQFCQVRREVIKSQRDALLLFR